jgi:hypothetical protein
LARQKKTGFETQGSNEIRIEGGGVEARRIWLVWGLLGRGQFGWAVVSSVVLKFSFFFA